MSGLQPEALLAVVVAYAAFEEIGCDCVVTAGVDGQHKPGSLHYCGAAVDLRSRNVPPELLPKLVARLRESLGEDFDVVQEKTHIHIEYDAQLPPTNA